MKTRFATLTITLMLMAGLVAINAQETEQQTAEQPKQEMRMMGDGMQCPMCGQMMPEGRRHRAKENHKWEGRRDMMEHQSMMHGQKGGQGRMMERMGNEHDSMMKQMHSVNLPDAQTLLAKGEELSLTGEQVKSLKDISLSAQKESIKKHADLAIARVELHALLDQEDIDVERVQQKVRQAADLEAELKIAHLRAAISAKGVLTADQRTRFEEIAKKRVRPKERSGMMQKGKHPEKPMRRRTEHRRHHQ